MPRQADEPTTRDRILDAATTLFASSGIKATTVARIEEAVGLRKGSGGVHRYFPTKDDLVIAVLERLYDRIDARVSETDAFAPAPLDDPEPALRAMGEFVLRESDALRELMLIGCREGQSLFDRFPRFRQRSFTAMLAPIAEDLRAFASNSDADLDPEAAAFVFLAPLLHHRLIEWLTGETPLGISDDRLVAEWAAQQAAVLRSRSG